MQKKTDYFITLNICTYKTPSEIADILDDNSVYVRGLDGCTPIKDITDMDCIKEAMSEHVDNITHSALMTGAVTFSKKEA